MGLFSKNNNNRGQENDAEDVDPLKLVLYTTASQENPILFLGIAIANLLDLGVIAAEDFAKIGITLDELDGLHQSLAESESAEEFDNALSVRAAVRDYDRVIEAIAAEREIVVGSDSHRSLRTTLATFAVENDITDLRIAYRLMLAECPDKLP